MKNMLLFVLVTCLSGSAALAGVTAQLNLRVERVSDQSSVFAVEPGESVDYQVIGSLSDVNNEGIALFIFDSSYSCGDLDPMALPNTEGSENFEIPLGIHNPGGPGGTPDVPGREGELVQVGAAWNTILNDVSNAPFPIGVPILGLGHTEAVLMTGSLTIPADATNGQVCVLSLSNVVVNVVRDGETEDGTFWAVDAGEQGTIGNMSMTTVVEPPSAVLTSSSPACDESLWRSEKNFVLLTFDRPITEPTAGQVMIQEITDAGGTGADLSADFIFTVEGPGGDVLRITEGITDPGPPLLTPLTHRHWYRFTNLGGWAGVANFERDYVVQVGDCTNDGLVVGADFSCVNAEISCFNCPDDRADINGDNRILGSDASLVNSKISSFPVTKPTGHACSP